MTNEQPGIWIIDASSKTVFANVRMADILGTTVSEMIGQPSFAYVFPEDAAAARRLFELKMHHDASPFRFRLRRKDGTAVWAEIQGTPMHDSTRAFMGIVGTFSPIAEPPGNRATRIQYR